MIMNNIKIFINCGIINIFLKQECFISEFVHTQIRMSKKVNFYYKKTND